jgi:hypothetical protein
MDIYEAPDIATAHRVSLISRVEGALYAESWQALPYDDFLDLLAEVSPTPTAASRRPKARGK